MPPLARPAVPVLRRLGRRPSHAELPALAAEPAARTGWAKLIGDWGPGDGSIPAAVPMAVVAVVRAAGGRVAVHAAGRAGGGLRQPRRDQRVGGDGGRRSIQHGTCLDPELLPWMAVSGTALTHTLSVIAAGLAKRPEPAGGRGSDWFTIGAKAHGSLIVQAAEAGLTLLAGTDSRPHGQIVDEIGALVAAGLRRMSARLRIVGRALLSWPACPRARRAC